MIKAGVIGATGFSGIELVRLLAEHPQVEISILTSQTYAGMNISEVYPHLSGKVDCILSDLDPEQVVAESDVIFVALPHGHSAGVVKEAYNQGKKIIDLGADFRLKSAEDYENWYKTEHTAQELLKKAVYGLPEVNRTKIKDAGIVANPGCYPTSVILALMPALKENLIVTNDIVIDSKSGVSGAGRKAKVGMLYSICNESISAYGVASHRHTPEIEQELTNIAGEKVNLLFTPHLTPMTRGILSTVYVKLKKTLSLEEVRGIYEEAYQDEYFVKVLKPGIWPGTKLVAGTNNCFINLTLDERTGRLVVVSVIDNLIKGAAGQAVQNMNILFALEEKTGLTNTAVYP
ncbi:MAG: N-acetyl-gamma-glutamyl-phosphate reductase [Clostridia bacterium]|nr:N-acetyl-gamma-glutamyl-phosphate reductase [Clostridia bacterium]